MQAPAREPSSGVAAALQALEARHAWLGPRSLRLGAVIVAVLAFYAVCAMLAKVDPVKLATGLPKLGHWLAQAWPPRVEELPLFMLRTAETVAMAAIGTTVAVLLALPMALLGCRNLTPFPRLYYPVRWFLNALRGIDSFVFALLFVAAVGLGPFAGVLGIALHTWGSAAKFFADHLEGAQMGPYDAVRATGSGRFTAISYALVPDVLPAFASISLFWWEFNVRASTVLGVVGAGGIGQELKNSMDLLDFSRLFTIIAVILIVITVLDQVSNWLRRKLV
jgi:phosphonate transport system permease protein